MLLGLMINMLIAMRYVLFNLNGNKIGEYKDLNDIPEECKNCYVMTIMSPKSTAWNDTTGDMFISIDY